MTTKPRGVKALVIGPLKKIFFFFCGFPNMEVEKYFAERWIVTEDDPSKCRPELPKQPDIQLMSSM